nr:TlpA family protein disulfide reductase [Actinomycetota bacterium]
MYAGDFRAGGTLESLQLPVLVGTGSVDYEDFADRPLVINFFASWCPSCISEMPAFEQVHRQLGDRVGFLGVSQSDPRDASIELARRAGITYPTGFDAVGSFFHATGALGMPTTIFVRAGGKIADVWVGPLDAGSLQMLIEEHFGP